MNVRVETREEVCAWSALVVVSGIAHGSVISEPRSGSPPAGRMSWKTGAAVADLREFWGTALC